MRASIESAGRESESTRGLRGQNCCFTHSRRNRRAARTAIPIHPRSRRQKAQANWLIFINMPQSKKGPSWKPCQIRYLPESHSGEGRRGREIKSNGSPRAGYRLTGYRLPAAPGGKG